jgi:hypothetical protein
MDYQKTRWKRLGEEPSEAKFFIKPPLLCGLLLRNYLGRYTENVLPWFTPLTSSIRPP